MGSVEERSLFHTLVKLYLIALQNLGWEGGCVHKALRRGTKVGSCWILEHSTGIQGIQARGELAAPRFYLFCHRM